ncbi:Crp/Fnr family transcriptional regulator [Peptostreptococcaceae bacterium OttesenSCG-928-C18]|nr:Crp/Fnr family transcriptional regulator [Peptostreptococcaceae bacterium OttesenSCG-928-C18]
MNKLLINTTFFKNLKEDEISNVLSCIGFNKKIFLSPRLELNLESGIYAIIVLDGSIDMSILFYNGKNTIVNRFKKGDSFICKITDENSFHYPVYSVSEKSEILILNISEVFSEKKSLCKYKSKVLENIIYLLVEENNHLQNKVSLHTELNLREKIIQFLISQKISNLDNPIILAFTRQELADYLSVNRSALSRELSKMEDDEIIRVDKKMIWFNKEYLEKNYSYFLNKNKS